LFGDGRVFGLSLPLTKVLNKIWRLQGPLNLEVTRTGAHSARIEHDGVTVVDILPEDAGERDALDVGREWAAALQSRYRLRGRPRGLVAGLAARIWGGDWQP
jgi:hypothetical protein